MTEYAVPPREGQSLADALDQIHDTSTAILALYPDDGMDDDLDALAIAAFRLDPPAFLLKSVK